MRTPGRLTHRAAALIAVVAVGLGVAAAACGSATDTGSPSDSTGTPSPTSVPTETTEATTIPETTQPPATSEPPQPATTSAPSTSTVPGATEMTVNVFWLRDTQIAVGGREVAGPALARAALDALLAGPNQLEQELGMTSMVPAGVSVLGLVIRDGVAVVDLSAEFEALNTGTAGETGLVAQIVYTLTQFPNVDSVDIWIDGEERDAILSHGLEATGLTREGLNDSVAPEIVVESPYPGELVTSPLAVSGFSRTFEATVVHTLTIPPSGEIVDEGFTTASQPDVDMWGPFSYTTTFDPDVDGFGAVIVFEESAQDGSQINIYEVPVLMEAGS